MLSGKRILVTGGTGSLGQALVRRILSGAHGRPERVIVFSRDEAKQYDMRLKFLDLPAATEEVIYHDVEHLLHFRIGDVRDYSAVASALYGVDLVFHAAALKQVPSCEYYPLEAAATNIQGVENIVKAVTTHGLPVEAVVGVSTDKACKPVNVMGMTKAIQERVLVHANLYGNGTKFLCVRYGNVLASRGSVVPLFHAQIQNGGPVTITTRTMTRFLLSLDQAVDTILDAVRIGERGDTVIPRTRSSLIETLAQGLIGERLIDIEEVGVRPGEKVHEILVSEEEAHRTIELEKYYVIRPTLPELGGGQIEAPVLETEFSSRIDPMTLEETTALLEENGLLIEDQPDFAKLY